MFTEMFVASLVSGGVQTSLNVSEAQPDSAPGNRTDSRNVSRKKNHLLENVTGYVADCQA
jgi:hypothetical protein